MNCSSGLSNCGRNVLPLTLCSVNARSVKSKSADFIELVVNSSADLVAVTETWLTDKDSAARLEIIPYGYKLINQSRLGRAGGGIALLYRDSISIKKIRGKEEISFEFAEFIVKSGSFSTRLVIVYHPPYSEVHPITDRAFLTEFTAYLESIILSVEPLLIVGDFNLHVDDPNDAVAVAFLDTLESLNLEQHVTGPTHVHNHTLDLAITRQSDTVLLRQPKVGYLFSDHAPIFCSLKSVKPRLSAKSHTYRKIKAVDVAALKDDLSVSPLCKDSFTQLDDLVNCYNTTLSFLTECHAPLHTRTVVNRPLVPWIDDDIKSAIRARRKAERKWRANKNAENLAAFKRGKNYATKLMNSARCNYYSDFIGANSTDQGKLFRAAKSLLSEPKTLLLPNGVDAATLANDIGDFFVLKVKDIHMKLNDITLPSVTDYSTSCSADVTLKEFNILSVVDVKELISRLPKKTSCLDPMPTSLVLQCSEELLPVITVIVNMSLQSGQFAGEWKKAMVTPLLKKCGIDLLFKNLRPVSNLAYISKLIETAVANQVQSHMFRYGLYPVLQSAYRQCHSTETALLKVRNDILLNMNKQHVTLLVLLDLSAAFDTVNHVILLERLKSKLGIGGTVLSWFRSYLSGRSQRVVVDHKISKTFHLECGVPQGSCLGPLLFNIYVSCLFQVIDHHLPDVHCYADDSQLYLSFSPKSSSSQDAAVCAMEACIADIKKWTQHNSLMLNDDKTEFIIIGTRQQLAKVDVVDIRVGNHNINKSKSVRNLGAWFNDTFDMSQHVSNLSGASFYQLHNIRRIRKYLTQEAAESLVHSFVTCRIDYCNSLLYGLPNCQLAKLQRVQNAAARLVYRESKFCHITPLLMRLHWLPISFRIRFKIALLTYKAINGLAPSYITELISIKSSSRYSLRLDSELRLNTLIHKSYATLGDRSFTMAAPQVWNSLPISIRKATSINSFKGQLKTHYYHLAYF